MQNVQINRLSGLLALAFVLASIAISASAQIIIFPEPPYRPPVYPIYPPTPIRPPRPPREFPRTDPVNLKELNVDALVKDQAADVRISQTFSNSNDAAMEAQYLFPVPEGSAIQDFTLMVDGKEMAGELMDKDKARGIYEEIVRRRRDPGLLEWAGRGLLRTSVFPIPGHSERTVTLHFTTLLPKDNNQIELRLPLGAPGQTPQTVNLDGRRAGKLTVNVRLESKDPIKTVYSPTEGVKTDRDGDHRASAKLEGRDIVPASEFRLIYGVAEGPVGATILSSRPTAGEDGYFLLMASPAVQSEQSKPLPKSVIFVLDRSGSMAGKKIEQARGAMRFVLQNLNKDDTFNIIAFDDRVETYKPELQRYDDKTRDDALSFVEGIRAGGSTNIDEAMRTALEMLPDDRSRPSYVIFMTDGLPTVGERNEQVIDDHAKAANKAHARIFTFGVGYDLNARMLDRISGDNGGATAFVKPEEDIEASVGAFYSKITSPVLSDIKIALTSGDVNRAEPRDVPDLFRGGQLVVAGRYRTSGKTTIKLSGRVDGKEKTYEFPADLADPGRGADNAFVERIWATRRIGELIDQIDLHGQNPELTDELVSLSKRYGILTPYTSFLAKEDSELASNESQRRFATDQLNMLGANSGGAGGVQQREMKSSLSAATAPAGAADFAAAAPALQPQRNTSPIGGAGGGGGRGGRGGRGGGRAVGGGIAGAQFLGQGTGQIGGNNPADAKAEVDQSVRQIGSKTFYKRAGAWVDSEALDKDASKAESIKAYSDAWFALAKKLGPQGAAWLNLDATTTLSIEGKLYKIEPESADAAAPDAAAPADAQPKAQ